MNQHLNRFLTLVKPARRFAPATIVNRQRWLEPFLGWRVAQDVPLSTVSPVVMAKHFTRAVAETLLGTSQRAMPRSAVR